ncbi:MAG: YqgE/AlgH family protein [Planctomycetota bacterium]
MESLSGKLLVASPGMDDPNFARAVILMIEHHDEGALGLVLNRVMERRVEEVWEQITLEDCQVDEPLRFGGPCPGPVMMLHDRRDCAGVELAHGVCFSSEPEQVVAATGDPPPSGRPRTYFASYSGWGSGQLESELDQGAWLVASASRDVVFDPDADDGLWMRVLASIDRAIAMLALNPNLVPRDPLMN